MPTGKFAISGLRIFGKGSGENQKVENFVVSWNKVKDKVGEKKKLLDEMEAK